MISKRQTGLGTRVDRSVVNQIEGVNRLLHHFDFGQGKVVLGSLFLDPDLSFADQELRLSEDMLIVQYQHGKYVLDVGHVPRYEGDYRLRVMILGRYREPLRMWFVRTFEELRRKIDEAVRLIHGWMERPEEIRVYSQVFPAPDSSASRADRLLGNIEIAWEAFQPRNVTSEMVEKVEAEWGVRLPDRLKEVIRHCDGGGRFLRLFRWMTEREGKLRSCCPFTRRPRIMCFGFTRT